MDETESELEVNIEEVEERFYQHLISKGNKNIFFSGTYGIGKSTFLREFFKNRSEYYAVNISPVNYVVSSNENIFELIKVDIIRQLFDDGTLDFESIEVDKIRAFGKYVKEKPLNFVFLISSMLSKLDPLLGVFSVAGEIDSLIDGFDKFEKKLNKDTKSKNEQLLDWAQGQTHLQGTYLEFNTITYLIKVVISEIKSQNTVLIIDDLDRLDPEHVFRILNIFSAHNHHLSNDHKFGFDQVLLVADVKNLESLYKHRYGETAEFEGYLDKFYSNNIFEFSNDDALISFISKNLRLQFNEAEHNILVYLLRFFVRNGSLKIRNIIKYKNIQRPKKFKVHVFDLTKNPSLKDQFEKVVEIDSHLLWFDSNDVEILYVFQTLVTFFGRTSKLKEAIKNLGAEFLSIRDLHKDLARSFAILHTHWNHSSQFRPYFNLNGSEHPRSRTEYITNSVLGLMVKLQYRWNHGNPYKGDVSFFEGIHYQIEKKGLNELNLDELKVTMLNTINLLERKKLI